MNKHMGLYYAVRTSTVFAFEYADAMATEVEHTLPTAAGTRAHALQ